MNREEFEQSFQQAAIALGSAGITCQQFLVAIKATGPSLEQFKAALAKLRPKTTKSVAIAMQLAIQGYQCAGFDFNEGFYFRQIGG